MTPPVYSESLLIFNYVRISPTGKFMSDWYGTPVYWRYESTNSAVSPFFIEFFSRDYCDHITVYEHDTDTIPSQIVPFTPRRRTVPKRLRLDYQDWWKENNSYHG